MVDQTIVHLDRYSPTGQLQAARRERRGVRARRRAAAHHADPEVVFRGQRQLASHYLLRCFHRSEVPLGRLVTAAPRCVSTSAKWTPTGWLTSTLSASRERRHGEAAKFQLGSPSSRLASRTSSLVRSARGLATLKFSCHQQTRGFSPAHGQRGRGYHRRDEPQPCWIPPIVRVGAIEHHHLQKRAHSGGVCACAHPPARTCWLLPCSRRNSSATPWSVA